MNIEELRKNYRDDILRIADKYGVTDVRVFGSVARGDAKEGSDVDFVVKFPKDTSFITYGEMQDELEDIISCKVDLHSEKGISKYLKDEILSNSENL